MESMKTGQLLTNFFFAHASLQEALTHSDVVGIRKASKEIAEISEELDLRIPPRMIP